MDQEAEGLAKMALQDPDKHPELAFLVIKFKDGSGFIVPTKPAAPELCKWVGTPASKIIYKHFWPAQSGKAPKLVV